MNSFARTPISVLFLVSAGTAYESAAQAQDLGDAGQGKTTFQQSCAICHADSVGPGNAEIVKQGPSLVGVVGRGAAASTVFNYTEAMRHSGLTWDAPTLDRYLTSPTTMVPGTTMPISIADARDRSNIIAYLSTLKISDGGVAPVAVIPPTPAPLLGPQSW